MLSGGLVVIFVGIVVVVVVFVLVLLFDCFGWKKVEGVLLLKLCISV